MVDLPDCQCSYQELFLFKCPRCDRYRSESWSWLWSNMWMHVFVHAGLDELARQYGSGGRLYRAIEAGDVDSRRCNIELYKAVKHMTNAIGESWDIKYDVV